MAWLVVSRLFKRDVVQDDAFPVVEAHVERPVLPLDPSPGLGHVEGHSLRLGDVFRGLTIGSTPGV